MADALWIGGPPGTGKTSVATRLMRRHGLRLYSSDTQTWAHRDRALAAGNAAAVRWESLSPAERPQQPPAELLAQSLHRERGAMVVVDVRALPSSPLVVAEGSVITPAAVPELAPAVWLFPVRAETNRLYALVAAEIASEVATRSAPVIAVDGLAETVAAVEELFAEPLARGPRAQTLGERQSLLREANLARVAQVRAYYARPWAAGDADSIEQKFICECGDPACEADVMLKVGAAAAAQTLAPEHSGRGASSCK